MLNIISKLLYIFQIFLYDRVELYILFTNLLLINVLTTLIITVVLILQLRSNCGLF